MKSASQILVGILLVAAVFSGGSVVYERWTLLRSWQQSSPEVGRGLLQGPMAPLIARVEREVPANGTMLLFAGLDPALLPYYLYPRKIWQPGVDPETNAVYMELPPSPYPLRRPETFAVDWYLDWFPDNAAAGGSLAFVGRAGGGR